MAELDAILDYISDQSPRGAARIKSAVKSIETLLELHLLAGETTPLPWLRRIKASGYPDLIFYEGTDGDVIIHAVRHAARAPSSMPRDA